MRMKQKTTSAERYGLAALLALAMALSVLTGCSERPPEDPSVPPQTERPEETAGAPEETASEPEPDPLADALEQYRAIAGQADTYDYDGADDPTGEYRYALVRMSPEDPLPTLLLEQDTSFGISSVLLFRYDPDSRTVLPIAGTLQEGVAGAGGYRGSLSAAGDGYGLLSTEYSSGTGEGDISRVTLEGGSLRTEVLWEGFLFDDTDPVGDTVGYLEIDWHGVGDTGALESWPPEPAQAAPDLSDGDRIVFTGSIGLYSYNEVLALQDLPDPDPDYSDPSQMFRLILLDAPQSMTLRSGSGEGSYEGEVVMIDVTWAEGLEQYDGQHLTFSIDGGNTWWPSDVSLPIGQPRTEDVRVLG